MINLFREIWMRLACICYWQRRNARFFVILGAPGSGKGTISTLLSDETEKHDGVRLPVLVTGNLVRREIADKTPFGVKWAPVVKSGGFIPDNEIMKLLHTELKKPEYFNGAILDGLPRTVGQARKLRRMLMWWGNRVNRVVLLDASDNDLLVRLEGRRTCSKKTCGKTYHTSFNPPKVEGKCNVCGSELTVRDDDKPEVVRERQRLYKEASRKLLHFYELNGQLTRVVTSNTRSVDEVLKDVVFTIEQFD